MVVEFKLHVRKVSRRNTGSSECVRGSGCSVSKKECGDTTLPVNRICDVRREYNQGTRRSTCFFWVMQTAKANTGWVAVDTDEVSNAETGPSQITEKSSNQEEPIWSRESGQFCGRSTIEPKFWCVFQKAQSNNKTAHTYSSSDVLSS